MEWLSNGVSASKRGSSFAHRDTCGAEINIGHGGVNNVRKHQQMAKVATSNTSLRALFRQSPIVTRAEVLFTLSQNIICHFGLWTTLLISRPLFPESQTFKSAHTKTTCIVRGALHLYFAKPVDTLCQEYPFSILCDEGSDNEDDNFVKLWDEKLKKPVTRFLDMPV